ncbi:MAG: response regulator, partial [Rhodocyclaceae bacterium]|nr:response regulator [Rhodocyclaceae bacterium]
ADDELANSPEVWQQLIFPEELPRVLDNFHEHVRTRGDTPYYNEVRYRHKNGSTVWVICAGKVVQWGDAGEPVRMVGCHIDVTSQHEKVEELILANSRADSASRAKSAFLANMSHEIRTPIHAIVGMAHVLRGRIGDPGHLAMLGKIDAAAAHLLGVINDILDLARIEADKLVLDDSSFMLNQAVDNVASMVAQRVAAKGLQLKVEVAADLALVGDATRYTQALLNLAANAVKFTESGQICIRVFPLQVTETTVELRSEVEDSGPGIANEVLQRLFAPFEQGDMSSTRKAGGSGLGLTITRRLARLMQGDAGVDTQTGRGSTFWFTARFGVDTGRAADKLASVQRDSGAEQQIKTEFAGRCILVAEDEPVNQEVAALILQDLGLQVVVAENGEQAVHSVQNGAVDLVLMDMQMPVMSGLAATRAIRALGDKGELPIVAMTANAFED